MQLHFSTILRDLDFLLIGIKSTVILTVLSMAVGLVIGFLAALARMTSWWPVRWASAFYVDFFRSTPVLVQVMWVFFALPILLRHSLSPFAAGTAVLSLHVGANLAEIYRAGILSIPSGQRYAGLAIGMTGKQVMARIILPQAVIRMLPPMTNAFISLLKDSSIISVISIAELMRQALSLVEYTMRPLEVLTVTALLYFCLAYPLSLASSFLHRRYLSV
jgi:His/Glu/Gln/Arg/opine family amino acid ABC transporter permease subunit